MEKMIVSGAGLVGSLLAYSLKKQGFDVSLFEKRNDMRDESLEGGRSINLIVTSRGINALKTVGLWEDVKKITVPVTGRMMHDKAGNLAYQPYGRDENECNFSISRSGLNKLLLDKVEEIGVPLSFEDGLLSLDLNNRKAVFSKSGETGFSQFFGCDGAGSPTRRAMIETSDSITESIEWLGADYKELLMPADSNGDYPIEKNALHIWPRGSHMLMALPNLEGSFTMTLYNPDEGDLSLRTMTTKESVQSHFESEYPDSIPLMPNYIAEVLENPVGKLGTVRTSQWNYEDKAVLLGDAAHAIVPFFGQGMNCGFEDVFYLLKFYQETKNWGETFKKYDEFQRPNGNAIADMAIDNYHEMKERVGDPKFLFRKKVEAKIEERFAHKYRSRYGLVTYTLVPYDQCLKIGEKQNKILDEICHSINDLSEIDYEKADKLISAMNS